MVQAGWGGRIRDMLGVTLASFSIKLGSKMAHVAEVYTAYHGVELVITQGYRKIIVEGDTRNVIMMLTRKCTLGWEMVEVIGKIKIILHIVEVFKFQHTSWEENSKTIIIWNDIQDLTKEAHVDISKNIEKPINNDTLS